ncbi:hypothetical protein [Saccharothrix australiensis]|uniref:hypothetical protein n=1 Tax=Saccharothrix australiensis TaxID=2072 RepID=UPI0014778097|nr:hypothetical protein [Saccharothrix australiensis]
MSTWDGRGGLVRARLDATTAPCAVLSTCPSRCARLEPGGRGAARPQVDLFA